MAKNIKAEDVRGTEQCEVKNFVGLIRPMLYQADSNLVIETQQNVWYTNYCKYLSKPEPKQMPYAVDILVSENNIPRVIIECKIKTYNTHSVIDYSEKAGCHKNVYPHLRYGFVVLNSIEKKFNRRYYEHAKNFDFEEMFTTTPSDKQLHLFVDKILAEVRSSREREKVFFG